ncbi:Putative ribonuclease H protein At1g65750 [Linum perenne]
MHPDKAPGPDGLNPAFYQSFWEVLGKEIADDCRRWLAEKIIPVEVRATNIVLIPKKDNPTRMADLRPISLCNVRYRILAKVLANRLRGIMTDIIPEEQSAFIQGRSIIDNVLIAVETLHALNLRRSAKVGEVALKMDISKAFDRVEWRYLEAIMLKLGFAAEWVQLMMLCVSSVEYSVLFDTHQTETFKPMRGLRQGCPLSPFLFIICAEGLSAIIRQATDRGHLHGVRVCRGAPLVSHLLFADDSFFFFRAEIEEARRMRQLFDQYASASGQLINFEKSGIFFSRSTHTMLQDAISNVLGVYDPFDRGKYLGLPSVVGRNKKATFQYVKDRVWERIQKWKGRWLSKGGKEVLVKAVLQAIPTYCMNVFVLPVTMIAELERMLNSFWWGTKNSGGQGISWMRWERLCVRKEDGGMGFKDLHAFNLAMVGKQGWKFMTEPNALVTKIFKAKYFPRGDFLSATLKGSPSFAWHSIWKSQELIRQGYRWRVGDGKSVGIWCEPWLKRHGRLRIESAVVPGLENLRVEDLWIPGFRCWDEELLYNIFSPEDVAAIMEVNTLVGGGNDNRIWHYNKSGEYSVKSAYKVYMEFMADRASLNTAGSWKALWNQRVPPKVCHFLWRLGRGVLPLRSVLRRRHINVPAECGLCNTGSEDELHLFINCSKTKEVWSAAGLLGKIESTTAANSFDAWLGAFLQHWGEEDRSRGAMVLWSIWGERNQIVWNHESRTARLVADCGLTLLTEWRLARGIGRRPRNQGDRTEAICDKWHPPGEVQLKCNVDAAFRASSRDWGWGAVVRNHSGALLSFRTGWLRGTPEVREGEAMALLDAMLWIQASGVANMVFETDSSVVAAAVMGHNDDHTEFGAIINHCRGTLHLQPGFVLKNVRRNRNLVAHELAQRSFSFISPTVGHVSPIWLDSALANMCTNTDH